MEILTMIFAGAPASIAPHYTARYLRNIANGCIPRIYRARTDPERSIVTAYRRVSVHLSSRQVHAVVAASERRVAMVRGRMTRRRAGRIDSWWEMFSLLDGLLSVR